MVPIFKNNFSFRGMNIEECFGKFQLCCLLVETSRKVKFCYMLLQPLIIIFRSISNIQENLFIQYSIQWGQISFFLSDQNCQLFLFKNK